MAASESDSEIKAEKTSQENPSVQDAANPTPKSDSDLGATASESKAGESASGAPGPQSSESAPDDSAPTVHPIHVSKLLDEVLEEPPPQPPSKGFKFPMVFDILLALGLLVAMGGFTVGLFKMYLTHSAEQSITQHNYKAAIAILKGAPVPGFFTIPGSDPDELLNQALYLDAMDKLDVDNDVEGALKQLQQIKPGSRYFELSQELIRDNFTPSQIPALQGGTSVTEEATPVEDKPKLPEHPKDAND